MTMNAGQKFSTGNNYGTEDHFGGYGAAQYSGQAHDSSGLWSYVADHLGYESGQDPSQLGQYPSHMDGGQQYDMNGEEWNGDYSGGDRNGDYIGGDGNGGYNDGEWNPGDGQDPEEWYGDYHMDPDGGSHHFSNCAYHHDQQGVYHHTAPGGYQNNPQGDYQNNSHGGYQNDSHGGYQNNSHGGYQNNSQGGEEWYDGHRDGQQGGQEWDDGYDKGDEDYGAPWNGQPTDDNDPGFYSEEHNSVQDANLGGQYAPPGPAPVPPSAHPEDGGQQAPTGNAILSHSEHPQDDGQHVNPGHDAAASSSAHPQGGADGFHIELKNTTTSSNVYAYITGQANDHGNALFILGSDGQTAYYPPNPSGPNTPLSEDCGINLGNPGNTVTVTIPHIAGGRIWFAIDAPLKFSVNPGPALMEPSVTNESDPNFNTNWGFCELTYSQEELYANISYVDFVSIPISLELTTENGATQTVSGMAPGGLDEVCDDLRTQHAADGKGWDQLVVTHNGRNLRALSPNQGMVSMPALFSNYYDEYINQVWERFSKEQISVDTQGDAGRVSGLVSNDVLNFGSVTLNKPSTHDIFTCSTGPFQTGKDEETNAIIPRIGAAFNRSTLLTNTAFPELPSEQYKGQVTNHYSRIVHKANLDGKGYAFPYDDVQMTGGPDQSGEVHASDPKVLTVTVGGGGATAVALSH